MNILYIGPYRQQDGWGLAARDYAKALDATRHNVAIRPIYMSSSVCNIDDEQLLDMENRKFSSYDMIVQKILPHLYEWYDIPSIGLFTLETDIKHTHWSRYIKMMDAVLVPSMHEKKIVQNLPYEHVYNISQPTDISIFDTDWGRLDGISDNTFNFYFIGELIERKNLSTLIIAFYTEFKRSEQVNLIIKTNRHGVAPSALGEQLKNDIEKIKQKLRIYENINFYRPIQFITDFLPKNLMCALHKSCHCFVMPSYGEAMCRPAVDAMGFGNTVIVTDKTGMIDFVNKDTGWVVPSITTPVVVSSPPLPWIYTGRETWSQVDIMGLRKAMREAFELDNKKREIKQERCKTFVKEHFSYKNIGQRIERALDDHCGK